MTHNPPMATSWSHYPWRLLLESEKSFYMEYYAPIENNLKVMPENNDLVSSDYYIPNEGQLNYVIDTGENHNRSIGVRLTDGQRNAVIFWIEDHAEYMRQYMGRAFDIMGDHPYVATADDSYAITSTGVYEYPADNDDMDHLIDMDLNDDSDSSYDEPNQRTN